MHYLAQQLHPKKERQCIHRTGDTIGEYYRGDMYISSLQRVRGSAAYEIAQRVGSFFWADAPQMRVWLCGECAKTLAIK